MKKFLYSLLPIIACSLLVACQKEESNVNARNDINSFLMEQHDSEGKSGQIVKSIETQYGFNIRCRLLVPDAAFSLIPKPSGEFDFFITYGSVDEYFENHTDDDLKKEPNPLSMWSSDLILGFKWGEFERSEAISLFAYKFEGDSPYVGGCFEVKDLVLGQCPGITGWSSRYFRSYASETAQKTIPENLDADFVTNRSISLLNLTLEWVNSITTSINPSYTLW